MNYLYQILVIFLLFYKKSNKTDASPLIIDRSKALSNLDLKYLPEIKNKTDTKEIFEDFKVNLLKIVELAAVRVKSKIFAKIDENQNKHKESDENDGESEEGAVDMPDLNELDENITTDLVNEYILKFLTSDGNMCMLHGAKEYKQTWAYTNGSLVISNNNSKGFANFLVDKSYSRLHTDELLEADLRVYSNYELDGVIAFSAAFNSLRHAPYKTLKRIKGRLQYLTLKGNNFTSYLEGIDSSKNEKGIAWSTFPKLRALKELDISKCKIEFISSNAFLNMPNLTALYISDNKLLRIPSLTFTNVRALRYLDLSNQNGFEIDFKIPLPTIEQIVNLLVGVRIEQNAFKELSNLIYLDLSFTKLTKNSATAFSFLPKNIKYISLCYTSFPVIGASLFKNTHLRGLDMSGNSFAAYSLVEDSFTMLSKSLRFLFFEQANIKELHWLKKLNGLEIVSLSSNNINNAALEAVVSLKNIQVLDLGDNNIGNWYNQIFTNNTKLKVLNLAQNNINILTSEMLKDFQSLHYLGIGDNDFVCDCVLRDFVDIAIANNHKADCVGNVFESTQDLIEDSINGLHFPLELSDFGLNLTSLPLGYLAIIDKFIPMVKKSYNNIRTQMKEHNLFNLQIITNYLKSLSENPCPNPNQIILYDKINGSSMKFQLLDYEDIHYWCYNETEKMAFFELNCESRAFDDMIIESIQSVTNYVVAVASVVVFLTIVFIVAYVKRWHIHYYWSSIKTAALLSVAEKEKCDSLKDLSESDSNLMYDIFISYCQSDREWVLEELMPNIEIAGDLSICMHERDFEVGVPILDNIISCMDRSRCLMLLISPNFLLSHWCQFEMRLAQHRMFEASKEHLILVFLEDIPKRKRPKTLQYLMDVKTYIKWPSGSTPNSKLDEKKLFWKRLRRSIKNI